MRGVMLDLSADIDEMRADLTGALRLCGPSERRAFSVTGDPRNWRGTKLRFVTSLTDTVDGEGPQLSRAEGEWNTKDALRLTATLTWYRITGGATHGTATGPDPPDLVVTITLARGSEKDFLAICEGLLTSRSEGR